MGGDSMSKPSLKNPIKAFRSPPALTSATEAAAVEDMCSMSDVVRAALLRYLRERGLLNDTERTERAAHD
jgi:hypothetical protein